MLNWTSKVWYDEITLISYELSKISAGSLRHSGARIVALPNVNIIILSHKVC